jgi:hypothetical protein
VKGRSKHVVLGVLIPGYLAVALAGHLEVLRALINTGGEPHQITSEQKSRPLDSRPYWTQRKHLLPSTEKVEGPSELTCSIPESTGDWSFTVFQICSFTSLSARPVFPPYRPRDPPSA